MKFAYLAVMIVLILIVCVALRHEARTHGRGADAYTVKGADAYSFKAMWNDSVGAYVAAIEMGGPHTGIVDTASPYLQVFDTYPCPASIECSPPLGQTKTTFADGTTAEQTFVRVSGGRVAIGGVDLPRNSVIGATTGHGPGSLGQIGTVGLGSLAGNSRATPQTNWSWFDSMGGKSLAIEMREADAIVTIYTNSSGCCPFAPKETVKTLTQAQIEKMGVAKGTDLIVVPASSPGIPALKYLIVDVGAYYTHLPAKTPPSSVTIAGVQLAVSPDSYSELPPNYLPPGFGIIGVNDLRGLSLCYQPENALLLLSGRQVSTLNGLGRGGPKSLGAKMYGNRGAIARFA